ncbi:MAG: Ig-like domain-containing protein [Candidatus Krumholzibacteriia bacterium]
MRTSCFHAAYRFHAAIWLLAAALLAASLARAAESELILAPAGTAAGDWLGLYVAAAGDLDGDGTPDFAVGAPRARGAAAGSGVVYVYLGGPALDAVPDLVLQGEASSDQFGTAVAGCGDVNGDGWDDLVVGAPRHDGAALNAGRAYVYFGGPGLDDQPDLLLDGPAENAMFGYAVAGAGNMDGAGDGIIVGAPSGAAATGRAFVYFGGAALDPLPDLTLAGGGYFGWSVASAGDFDGDGWEDVMVGGNTLANVYLFAGGPGVDDQVDLLFQGDASSNRFGYGLAPAGDVNGDGWDDVVIGDMHNSAGAVYGGRAHVYFGGPGADGLAELVYTGTHERGIFGRTVAGAGDVNGDGLDDLLIGAPTPDTAGYGPGRAFVFYGGDAPGTSRPDTLADVAFTGEAPSDRLGSQVAVVPDLDGDGRAELLTGANLYDNGALIDAGRFYLHRVPNLAPVALADSVVLTDDQPVVIAVLANDGDPDGVLVPASVTVVAPPLHGLAEVDTLTGAIVYTQDLLFAGADSLAYTVRDREGAVSAPATVLVTGPDLLPPAPVDLLAAQGGHGAVALGWEGVPADADSLEIWRAAWRDGDGQSAYPLYDDAPGSAPPLRPADRAMALADTAWTLVARVPAATVALVDSVAARGVYHYEIFARDAAGNWGAPTDAAARALNYVLGDFADQGDGLVDTTDVAILALDYGLHRDKVDWDAAADVGPTDDRTATGIPVTDGEVDFEDVMIVAMNHGVPAAPVSAGGEVRLAWRRPAPEVWVLHLEEAHASFKGLRITLAVPVGVAAQVQGGSLAAAQAEPVFVANAAPDSVDAALVVLGGGAVFTGAGELLVITLSKPAELPAPTVTARAADNTDLATSFAQVSGVPGAPVVAFGLDQNSPNPFNPRTTIRFSLPEAGRTRLAVYDIRGRRVALLVDDDLAAGAHAVVWDGRDGRGAQAGSGVYLYRLEARGQVTSRRMTLVK